MLIIKVNEANHFTHFVFQEIGIQMLSLVLHIRMFKHLSNLKLLSIIRGPCEHTGDHGVLAVGG